ncbi:unnamed protein product, partial [Prorocentrum cordatum]
LRACAPRARCARPAGRRAAPGPWPAARRKRCGEPSAVPPCWCPRRRRQWRPRWPYSGSCPPRRSRPRRRGRPRRQRRGAAPPRRPGHAQCAPAGAQPAALLGRAASGRPPAARRGGARVGSGGRRGAREFRTSAAGAALVGAGGLRARGIGGLLPQQRAAEGGGNATQPATAHGASVRCAWQKRRASASDMFA